ncbi:MAG: M81 family metallopeptidase [Nitrospinae bacterium]|nr:M81 family metallopeptidase [Nitrospinota bacterium]
MRVAVGGFTLCVNSFATQRVDLARCQRSMQTGEAMLAAHHGSRSALGGFLAGANQHGIELVPLHFIRPGLGSLIARDAFDWTTAQFRDALQAVGRVDGLFLQLHGGGAGEGTDDCEGDLLAAVREVIGERVAILATLDGHANVTPQLVQHASMLIGVKTNPHHDFYERGLQAAHLMAGILDGHLQPAAARVQPPLVPSLQKQYIAAGWPMEDLVRRGLNVVRRDPRVLDVTIMGGFPYSECAETGLTVTVTTNNAPGLAEEIAESLKDIAWQQRHQFQPHIVPIEDAVREAIQSDAWPVVLGDVADSGGAGTPGDGTALLEELLKQGATGAVIGHLTDPEAVGQAVRAGVGQQLTLTVGGKVDTFHGRPVQVTGQVRSVHEGDFVTSTPFNSGLQRRGTTVVLACDGIEIILTSNRAHSFEPNTFRSVGIEPTERRILVAKSELQHRAGLAGIGKTFIDVDTPGLSTPVLTRLPYRKIRRPVFPLDDL